LSARDQFSTEQVMKKFSIVLAALATIVIAAPQTASAMNKEGMGMHHKMHHKMTKHHKMHHEKTMKQDKM
jgi:Ni/Co efflux regulator RcnB